MNALYIVLLILEKRFYFIYFVFLLLVILEIIEEMRKAQIMYSRLPHKTSRNIVAPTVKDRCKDIDEFLRRSKKSVVPSEPEPTEPCLPPLAELPPDEEEPCICDEPGAGEKSDDQEPSEPDEIEPICKAYFRSFNVCFEIFFIIKPHLSRLYYTPLGVTLLTISFFK